MTPTGGERAPLRALLVHVDELDECSAYYLHHVGMWSLSEIALLRRAADALQDAWIGPVVVPRPLVMVELGADLRRLPNGATTTATAVANVVVRSS